MNQKCHDYENIKKMYEETNNLNDLLSKKAQTCQIDELRSKDDDI